MNTLSRSFAFARRSRPLFAAPARAEDVKAGDLVITQAWSRATPSGAKIAGGYLDHREQGHGARTGWSAAPAISRARSRSTRWR